MYGVSLGWMHGMGTRHVEVHSTTKASAVLTCAGVNNFVGLFLVFEEKLDLAQQQLALTPVENC